MVAILLKIHTIIKKGGDGAFLQSQHFGGNSSEFQPLNQLLFMFHTVLYTTPKGEGEGNILH